MVEFPRLRGLFDNWTDICDGIWRSSFDSTRNGLCACYIVGGRSDDRSREPAFAREVAGINAPQPWFKHKQRSRYGFRDSKAQSDSFSQPGYADSGSARSWRSVRWPP